MRLEQIFPLKMYLHIFQLEEYQRVRFIRWVFRNLFKRSAEGKKPLVWTPKAGFFYNASLLLLVVWLIYAIYIESVLIILLWFVLVFQPWILLVCASLVREPYEMLNRWRIKEKMRRKIESFSGLRVIGITGSFGKTTTKEFLYQILQVKYRVLRTPASFNTLFGIEKVIRMELDDSYDFFICEMGAYKRGEIAEICSVVKPKMAILTGISEQHLERFGNLENTVKAKFELVESVLGNNGLAVVNIGNDLVRGEVEKRKIRSQVVGVQLTAGQSPLKQDWRLAASLAARLGVSKNLIEKAHRSLKHPEHRLRVVRRPTLTIIDDAYSSNPDGFVAALNKLSTFPDPRVVVTPGIIELGKASREIHIGIGRKMAGIVSGVVLVGRNERTENIKLGLVERKFKGKVDFVEKVGEAFTFLEKFKMPTVLFENDLPDNY